MSNANEKDECFNAIDRLPAVQKKAKWALEWIENASFQERLIAFAAVEGIFFSGSFCSIFWLKSRGIMQGLCNANALIFKDENLHCDFAIHLLNNHVENKPSEKLIKKIGKDIYLLSIYILYIYFIKYIINYIGAYSGDSCCCVPVAER